MIANERTFASKDPPRSALTASGRILSSALVRRSATCIEIRHGERRRRGSASAGSQLSSRTEPRASPEEHARHASLVSRGNGCSRAPGRALSEATGGHTHSADSASTNSPTLGSGSVRATSARATIPTSRSWSITGSRRTRCSVIVASTSSALSSAPIVTASC